jgi:hypothetical protein
MNKIFLAPKIVHFWLEYTKSSQFDQTCEIKISLTKVLEKYTMISNMYISRIIIVDITSYKSK